MSFSAEYVLRGVRPGWLELFEPQLLATALAAVKVRLAGKRCCPSPELIFEPFRYGEPGDCDVVIVGQDPYPTIRDAQGICFSAPAVTPSSRAIFACLAKQGHMVGPPTSGDLRSWVAQGVLMMNSAVTTAEGERGGHLKEWQPFVASLMAAFSKRRTKPAHFLLWGGKAAAFASVAERHGHIVHIWSHPSPVGDNRQPEEKRFVNCTHFGNVNKARAEASLPRIIWDNGAGALLCSDGASSRNGKPGARASFAAVCLDASFDMTFISGLVEPRTYEFVDSKRPESGWKATKNGAAPSNVRGEYLGVAHCLLAALRARITGPVEIGSDSQIALQTLLEWYPNRLANSTTSHFKNLDLVEIMWTLYTALRAQTHVTLTFRRGHREPLPPTASPREHCLWAGNKKADRIASSLLADAPDAASLESNPELYAVKVVSPLACLKA